MFLLNLETQGQGKYDEAEPLYRETVDIFKKALAPDHPNVAMGTQQLSCVPLATGRSIHPWYQFVQR